LKPLQLGSKINQEAKHSMCLASLFHLTQCIGGISKEK
jgi:hypothetical protein